MPRGFLGLEARRKPGMVPAFSFRTGRQCLVHPWQMSPPMGRCSKAEIFSSAPRGSRAPGTQGCGGCSRSQLGLTTPSHSPDFLAEWAGPGILGLGHMKDEGQRRREGEEGNLQTTVFFAVLTGCSCLGFLCPLPSVGRSPPHHLPCLPCQLGWSCTAALS